MSDLATHVLVTDHDLIVTLSDGKRAAAPLREFPRLLRASAAQRRAWRLIGEGEGIHWPDVDEDISVAALIRAHNARAIRT